MILYHQKKQGLYQNLFLVTGNQNLNIQYCTCIVQYQMETMITIHNPHVISPVNLKVLYKMYKNLLFDITMPSIQMDTNYAKAHSHK